MKKIVILFLLLGQLSAILAQKTEISGYVSDAKTGERIIGAYIINKSEGKVVTTNNFGFYSISCENNQKIDLQCSFIGYQTCTKSIENNKKQFVNFFLEKGISMGKVVITANKQVIENTQMGTSNLYMSTIKLMPSLGGENDLMKVLKLLPGVQGGTEGSSGLYVRGGGIDQNLILLDDVPLYYVNHLGGFVSIFNSDAIKNVKLIKGGFPARYGGRLSSVVDIRMKDGNMKKLSGNFSLGLLTSKLMLEGPIKKDTSSFLFSFRGMFWGFAYAKFSRIVFKNLSINYNFYDINAKYSRKLNDKNRLYLSFYYGDDNFVPKVYLDDKDVNADFPSRWGNFLTAFRWNKVFNSKFFSNTTFAYTRYRYKNEYKYWDKNDGEKKGQSFFTGINDFSIKEELQYYVNNNLNIRTGVNGIMHQFSPGNFNIYSMKNDSILLDSSFGNPKIYSKEINFYVENKIKVSNLLNLNIGIRTPFYFVDNKAFVYFEPRIIANLKLNDNTSIKLSYTQNHQNIHLLSSSTVNLPVDMWMPATKLAIPEKSCQYSIGFYKILNNKFILTSEIYYKKMTNLIDFKEGQNFYGAAQNWEQKIETNGIGTSYGLELLLQKKSGNLTGWVSYDYANTTRQFENINNNIEYPFKYDRRHTVKIYANYHLNSKINFSADWIYGSGYPFTFSVGQYAYLTEEEKSDMFYKYYKWIDLYPGKNTFRMRAFHHLDIAVNFTKKKKNVLRTWSISIYNVYNRQNPFYYYIGKDNNGELHLYQKSLFPIIPSLSYSLKF